MNPFFAEMQAVAEELISEFGQSGTVTRYATPDPVYGGEPVPDPHPAKVFPDKYEAREIDGSVIEAGDVKIYISSVGLAITPKPGDTATCNGKAYRIINSDPQMYDGVVPVVHIVQGRLA